MKTDDLIALMARDTAPVPRGMLPMRLAMLGLAGAGAALVGVVVWLGIRPDLADAMTGMTYWMKTLYTLGLGIAGFALAERLSRPGAKGRLGMVLAAVFLVAMIALAVREMMATPPDQMRAVLMGSSWSKCPWLIFGLSLPGLALLLWAMRRSAPTRPMIAGAAAGLLAGGLAATVYGLHCQEVAAPFVALWYSLGMILSATAGAVIGSRVLRW